MRPSCEQGDFDNRVTYGTTTFSIGKATVVFYKTKLDMSSQTHATGINGPNEAELTFWLRFMGDKSQEPGSPFHMYNTVYLNLHHGNPEGIDFLFEDTGFSYKWIDNVLFLWLDALGLTSISASLDPEQQLVAE